MAIVKRTPRPGELTRGAKHSRFLVFDPDGRPVASSSKASDFAKWPSNPHEGDTIVYGENGPEWTSDETPFNPNETYPNLTAGHAIEAKAITAVSDESGDTQTEPFFMQATATENNTGSTPTGKVAEIKEIRGQTYCYNQLADGGNDTIPTISGHKYWTLIDGTKAIVTSDGSSIVLTDEANDKVVDLTLWFNGSIPQPILDSADAFPGNYWLGDFTYNVGELKSVDIDSLVTVEFNQWDEEWESGSISVTGAKVSDATAIRSKNYIPIVPNTDYKATQYGTTAGNIVVYFYDSNKQYINYTGNGAYNGGFNTPTGLFTTPKDARYILFRLSSLYGTTYKNDICINLHWDGERDGEYSPYAEHTYPISFSGKSAGSVSDSLAPDGTKTTRIGSYTFTGSESWTFDVQYQMWICPIASDGKNGYNYFSSNGVVVHKWSASNVCVYLQYNPTITEHTDMNALFPSGTVMYYELATPTTSTETPFTSTIEIDDYGTMRFEKNSSISTIPVGNEIFYPADYVLLMDDLGNYTGYDVTTLAKKSDIVVPSAPTTDGTYVLTVTVADGEATYTWESTT